MLGDKMQRNLKTILRAGGIGVPFSVEGWTLLLFLLVSAPLYVGVCALWSKERNDTFDAIQIGDRRNTVVCRFGKPSHIEQPGALFTRYASRFCQVPCVERLWFENRMSLDFEAWSVELDRDGKVVRKDYWVLP